MDLVIGGAFQGKTDWAKTRFGLTDADIFECTPEADWDLSRPCVTHLEYFALRCLRAGKDPRQVLEEQSGRWEHTVFICDDISCGVVPLDAEMRAWRECCGHMLSYLSVRARSVTRLFCGLPQRLK